MYECFHCGAKAVIWDCDYDFNDFGYDGEGIVHICHCANCGAEIEYRISINNCETCRHKDESWHSEACDGCRLDSHYEPMYGEERSEE